MNFIFTFLATISTILIIINNPDALLEALLSGGEKAFKLSSNLIIIYAVWLGIFSLLEKSGLNIKVAKLLRPINKFFFGELDEKTNEYVSLNISANILGMSGATTPMGIKSVLEMEKDKKYNYAITMFFVINATSVQIIPSSVLALRQSMNSLNPSSIIIPTILSTMVSSIVGVLLVKVFVKR